jgi:hypothetical protein
LRVRVHMCQLLTTQPHVRRSLLCCQLSVEGVQRLCQRLGITSVTALTLDATKALLPADSAPDQVRHVRLLCMSCAVCRVPCAACRMPRAVCCVPCVMKLIP